MGANVKTLSNEIREILLNALNRKGWYFFKNDQLCKCWEELKCGKKQCPSYKSPNLRCWQVAGTYCKGAPQGDFVKKIGDCQKCRVYKKSVEGNPILQIGEDFNNLMFHLKQKDDELRKHVDITEGKNRELDALNKKIRRLLKKLDSTNTQLKDLSIRDGLTGLYNYRYFIKLLREQFSLSKRYQFPLSCVMIDIDFFKAVNDTYGHQFGDRVLKQLADILVKNVRDTDRVVRYGGEEFVVLLPHTDQDDAYIKAERIRNLVSSHLFKISGESLNITISAGIASYPLTKNIRKAERITNYADKALYQAKEQGRNRTVLYSSGQSRSCAKAPDSRNDVIDRRKNPRIQTMVKIRGEFKNESLPLSNAFDISCSGLSILSGVPIDIDRTLKIELHLPDLQNKKAPAVRINVEGLVVRCQPVRKASSKGVTGNFNFVIGVQFVDLRHKHSVYLQKFFVSMFKRGCIQ